MNLADDALDALEASLTAALPQRHVQRGMVDPAAVPREQLLDGVVCLVCGGGGDFANYLGREGELGRLRVSLVGFVVVAENSPAVDVERAELALLGEWLAWTQYPNQPGMSVLPQEFRTSEQMEHPYGWVTLALDVRP